MTDTATFADPAVLRTAASVVLYGAGQVGRDVCRALAARGVRVRCFLDRAAATGQSCAGIPVHPPCACPLTAQERDETPVVLSVFNRDVDVVALAGEVRALGFSHVVSFVALHDVLADALGDRFWLTSRDALARYASDMDAAAGVWADEHSREVYGGLLALRRRGEYSPGVTPRRDLVPYFRPGIPGWLTNGPHRFVDCGAYRGDTVGLMLEAGVPVEASAHFEPDLENFGVLVRVLRERRHELGGPALAWPCAVGARCGTVGFQEGLQEASSVSEAGAATVTAVALDAVLVGWRPTFVKMDIEGSEVDALRGAAHTLAERPHLAICVYHRPDHLWRIPLMLFHSDALEGYRFYLRAHGHNGFDTVLYARPEGGPLRVTTTREVAS